MIQKRESAENRLIEHASTDDSTRRCFSTIQIYNLNWNAAVCYLEFEPNSVKIKRERVREKKKEGEPDIDTYLAQCFPTFQEK